MTASPRDEDVANAVSHGIGFLAALAAVPLLVNAAVDAGGGSYLIGVSVFAASMVALYGTSAVYHALRPSRAKDFLRVLDHNAIYLLIAGTYTPFTLGVLRGAWGWTLFGLIWGLALIGVLHKSFHGVRYPRLSTALYILMGWLVVVAIKPVLTLVPAWGVAWLILGGVAYTAGVWFYNASDRVRYAHFVWHLFVMAGTTCHFLAVLGYAA